MRKFFLSAATTLCLATGLTAAENPSIGVVNFTNCITESKAGKKEQENMETIRKQMSSMMESKEKELKEIAAKFDDAEFLDSLSPKAEEELKAKFQALQEELGGYQNQFYQVLNHANYQMIQKMGSNISKAAEKLAKEMNLDYVINKEACFYISDKFDLTSKIVSEMDKLFDLEAKKLSENAETATEPTPTAAKAG
jgi:outer membrane protein